MTQQLAPYPQQRDIELPWLPRMPAHWTMLRAKHIFTPVDLRSTTGSEELLTVSSQRGVVPRSDGTVTMFKAASYIGHKLCRRGDLVINSLWAWAGGLGFSNHDGIISSAYGVYRPGPIFASSFPYFDYLVRSVPFQWELQVRSKGVWTSRLQLTDSNFLDAPILVPPADERDLIAKYLAAQLRKTDYFIRNKRRLIALLTEQK